MEVTTLIILIVGFVYIAMMINAEEIAIKENQDIIYKRIDRTRNEIDTFCGKMQEEHSEIREEIEELKKKVE